MPEVSFVEAVIAAWEVLLTIGVILCAVYTRQSMTNRNLAERVLQLEGDAQRNDEAHVHLTQTLSDFRTESAAQHAELSRKVDAAAASIAELTGYLKAKRES